MIYKDELEKSKVSCSNFCNRHFHNLNAFLYLVSNLLIVSGSNAYVWMSDLKLETVSPIAPILFSL
jgi:hypothetical protein